METTFGIEQLYREIGKLRSMWGQKDFWTYNKADNAIKGLTVVYLNANYKNQDELETAASIFDGTIIEFHRRAMHMHIFL